MKVVFFPMYFPLSSKKFIQLSLSGLFLSIFFFFSMPSLASAASCTCFEDSSETKCFDNYTVDSCNTLQNVEKIGVGAANLLNGGSKKSICVYSKKTCTEKPFATSGSCACVVNALTIPTTQISITKCFEVLNAGENNDGKTACTFDDGLLISSNTQKEDIMTYNASIETKKCSCFVDGATQTTDETKAACTTKYENLKATKPSVVCTFNGEDLSQAAGGAANASVPALPLQPIKAPELNVPIPNLPKFSDIPPPQTAGGEVVVPWLGQYFAAAYQYFVGVGTIIAIILIMIGGIQWLMSGGSSHGVEKAKERITNAVTGLAMLLGSYLILYTINPEIVEFKGLRLRSVKKELLDSHNNPAEGQLIDNTIVSSDPIRAKNAVCTSYPDTSEGRTQCRNDCNSMLPIEKKSQPSSSCTSNECKKWVGSLDCLAKQTRDIKSIQYVGIHEGEAQFSTLASWWLRKVGGTVNGKYFKPGGSVSSHYLIAKNGTIHQITDERFIASHGVKSNNSIGIDVDGRAGTCNSSGGKAEDCNYTDAQYAAIKKLINEIITRTNVSFNDDHILGHCEVNEIKTGHADPRNFDWSKIGLDNSKHHSGNCLYTVGFPFGSETNVSPKK